MPVETTNIILLIAGALLAGLLWINHKQALSLRDQLPPAFTPLIPVFLNTITDLASRTETKVDDEVVEQIKELLQEKQTQQG